MKSFIAAMCLCSVLLWLAGCKAKQKQPEPSISEPGIQDSHSVLFDIAPMQGAAGAKTFRATYKSEGKVAKFRIELSSGSESGSNKPDDFKFVFGKGAIIAEPGSDASGMLVELKKALESKKTPGTVKRVQRLPFTYAILGNNQTLDPDGGFRSNPPGTWTAMKVFLDSTNPDDDCELFLNFSAELGKAEFSEKDADYGDDALADLATVL